jgi:flagellar hook-associated protein 1 FlgK
MTSIYGVLYTGKSALLAQQLAINTTGNNIANANTAGYCRQSVTISANEPVQSSAGFVGTGVKASEITRAQDSYLERRVVAASSDLGKWGALAQELSMVESVFTESTEYGLSQAMSDFWSGWEDLANNPSGAAERSMLVAYAENLANTFNELSSSLKDIQGELDASIDGSVQEINVIADQIADLNKQIAQAEINGQTANTYRDTRDGLLEEISGLIDINYYESDNGMVTVHIAGGATLVEGATSSSLSTEVNSSTGFLDIILNGSDDSKVVLTDKISNGKLKGMIEARDQYIPGYLDRIDELAAAIIEEVNTLHSSGFGLDGSTGYDFFTGSSAEDMAVNQTILDDNNIIAASSTAEGIPGDNGNALNIADTQEKLTMNGDSTTFLDFYTSLVSDIGIAKKTADNTLEYKSDITTSLDNLTQSISGVSIDEETVNLIMLQSAYSAAAKLVNVLEEMMDTLINL